MLASFVCSIILPVFGIVLLIAFVICCTSCVINSFRWYVSYIYIIQL